MRPHRREPEPIAPEMVATDDRGAPVPPIRRLCIAYRQGRRVPAIDGTSVVHADAFGRLVMRAHDLDDVETLDDGAIRWRLMPGPTEPDLARAIAEYFDRRRQRRAAT